MDINDKKFTRTRKVIYFLISAILAVFLIMLADTVIGDLSVTIDNPEYNDFKDKKKEADFQIIEKELSIEDNALSQSSENIYKLIQTAKENKDAEQQSFENWRDARGTLGTPSQDPEVLKRLAKVDEYQVVVQSWQAQYDSLSLLQNIVVQKRENLYDLKQKESMVVDEAYYKALDSFSLKVFLVRLLFAAPILALGIYLFVRHRRHKLSPIFMGISLCSVYVFFVGLVPYLPSYGGYVRYAVGILLTVGLGYYAIKRLRAYQERKSEEMKESSMERASKLQHETSEKAFNNHICPSCGKDFLLKNWEDLSADSIKTARPLLASNYCRHCGMQVIKKCGNCQQNNYAHLPYCINCGDKLNKEI